MKKREKEKENSPAYQLLAHVWEHAQGATTHSWDRLNHAMRGALNLAIGAGMRFDAEDWRRFLSDFRYGRWCGTPDSHFYTQAVCEGNLSACKAIEALENRSPLLADEVSLPARNQYAHSCGTRQRERLCVGARLDWKGERVAVTSLSARDGKTVATACSYRERKIDPKTGYIVGPEKILHRFTITEEAVREERRREKLWGAIHAYVLAHPRKRADVCKRLGIDPKTMDKNYVQEPPTKLLEKVAADSR